MIQNIALYQISLSLRITGSCNLLKERFENVHVLATSFIADFLYLPTKSRESSRELLGVISVTCDAVEA